MSYYRNRLTGWLILFATALLLSGGCEPLQREEGGDGVQENLPGVTLTDDEVRPETPPATPDTPAIPAETAPVAPPPLTPDAEPAKEDEKEPAATAPEPAAMEPEVQPDPETTEMETPMATEAAAPPAVEPSAEPTSEPPRAAAAPAENGTGQLAALSDTFREVARIAKPSVVQVAIEIQPGGERDNLGSQISPEEMEELMQRFGPLLELDPELRQFFHGRRFEQQGPNYQQYNVPMPVGSASGWVFDNRGHVITNHHVVAKADRIVLTFSDNTKAEAVLIGSDPQTDVAVLKTDKTGLTPARLAGQSVEQGDIVLAVGSPFEYAFSLSQGIVSATGRRMGILGPQGFEDFIQTDAAINPGNSGGPLINIRGEVVGMNTAIASRSGAFAGIGFAIPVEIIRDVADELIRAGRVERGYLGAILDDDPRLLASFGVERGTLIDDLVEGSPADRAGIEPGDVVVAVDGRPVENADALRQEVAHADPRQKMRFDVIRKGRREPIQVTIGQQPTEQPSDLATEPSQPAMDEHAVQAEALVQLGFQRLLTLTPEIAKQYGLEPSQGVLVLDVRSFSAAALAGLRRGNIITQVQDRPITDIESLREAVEGRDLNEGVRMRVQVPGGPARFTLLSLDGRRLANLPRRTE